MTTALDRLSQIIPQDQAIANKALSVSMLGITGISNMSLSQFANAVANVQTTVGLPLISAQKEAVSPASVNVILTNSGTGTGQNGTITIENILGTAVGAISANALTNAVSTFSTMNLTGLVSVYNEMSNTVNGVYGDPISGPITIPTGLANGTYNNANFAFIGESANTDPSATGNITGGIGLLSAAQLEISSVVSSYPTQTSTLNSDWANVMNQLALESNLQSKANLNFSELTPNSQGSIYGFGYQLPSYGQDTTVGGSAQFLQGVSDLTTLGGEAIVAVMRQGQTNLSGTAIKSNDQVPADPNPPLPQAELLPAQYPYPQPIVS